MAAPKNTRDYEHDHLHTRSIERATRIQQEASINIGLHLRRKRKNGDAGHSFVSP